MEVIICPVAERVGQIAAAKVAQIANQAGSTAGLMSAGKRYEDAIAGVIEGPVTAMCPGSVLQMHQFATVVIDEAAACHLKLADYYRQVYANLPDWQRLELS